MEKEIWKDWVGFEDLYQISNLGNIRSKDRFVNNSNQFGKCGKRFVKGKILKQNISNSGYMQIIVRINNKHKGYLVHRLVATHFIDNPNNYSVVNHIDGNKLNNKANNLEWCTQSHNVRESYRLGLQTLNKGCFQKGHIPWNKSIS